MSNPSIKQTREDVIHQTAAAFFGKGTLSEKLHTAATLSTMPGLSLFMTALPWKISLPQGNPITGLSESMAAAASDIRAHLLVLEKIFPTDTVIDLDIDETRLPQSRSVGPKIEGG